MNIQQPSLRAIKSYYRQILTQLEAICELVYNESELPINTLMNSGKRLGWSELPFYLETRFPACQSLEDNFDAQELSLEYVRLKQPSISQLYLPLNIKQTDAAMLYQIQLHSAPSWSALHPDPVGASGKESLFLPAPHLLPCPGNSTLKSKGHCLNCKGGHLAQALLFFSCRVFGPLVGFFCCFLGGFFPLYLFLQQVKKKKKKKLKSSCSMHIPADFFTPCQCMRTFPSLQRLGARWEHTRDVCEAGERDEFQFPGFSPGLSLPILTQVR